MRLRNQRFTYWRILWVVLAFFIFFLLIAVVAGLTSASSKNAAFEWNYIFNWGHLVSQLINLFAISFFFYITVNTYHRYFVERKNFIQFLKLGIIAFVACTFFFYAKHRWVNIDPSENRMNPGMVYFSIILYGLFYSGLAVLNAYV